jgi:hypothetical protein
MQLLNPRHELFCRMMLEGAKFGWSQELCYVKSGFRASGHSAAMAASRLMKRDDIRQRLAELSAPAIRRAQVSVGEIVDQLDAIYANASGDRQHGAAASAVTTKARVAGLLRDKLEVGSPGSFDGCQTQEEIVDKLLVDFGDVGGDPRDVLDALDAFREVAVQRIADRAQNITPEPSRPRPADETGRALLALRKSPSGRR